ncbi:hypothetical protein EDB87DRAFT_952059 [Lactarius vividus]|nr:hypothetical protein EDB87DRAFT_952059 [Lactarius vividus]
MYRKHANSVLIVLVSALSVGSITSAHTLFAFIQNVQFETDVMKKIHSLLGDDWPPFSPLTLERKVEMVVEESVHYAAGAPGAEDEWLYERRWRQQSDLRSVALPPRALSALFAQAAHELHEQAPIPAPPALPGLPPSTGAVSP